MSVDADFNHGFADCLDPYMLVGVKQAAVEAWIQPREEDWIKMALCFSVLSEDSAVGQVQPHHSVLRC